MPVPHQDLDPADTYDARTALFHPSVIGETCLGWGYDLANSQRLPTDGGRAVEGSRTNNRGYPRRQETGKR
jgi:hypothetical protein